VAKALRIDRQRTLPKLITAGLLHPIPWGPEQRFDAAEVAALAKRGGADLPVGRTTTAAARAARKARADAPAPPTRARRARRKGSTVADAIRSIPI
jgi:hypothetical protein